MKTTYKIAIFCAVLEATYYVGSFHGNAAALKVSPARKVAASPVTYGFRSLYLVMDGPDLFCGDIQIPKENRARTIDVLARSHEVGSFMVFGGEGSSYGDMVELLDLLHTKYNVSATIYTRPVPPGFRFRESSKDRWWEW